MSNSAKPLIGPVVAISIAGAILGNVSAAAADSRGNKGAYPPVPKVNKHSTIPQRNPLTNRPALAPKSGLGSGKTGRKTGPGEEGPRYGVERVSPERQIPDAPVAATSRPAGANSLGGPE